MKISKNFVSYSLHSPDLYFEGPLPTLAPMPLALWPWPLLRGSAIDLSQAKVAPIFL